jgi:hypothetical protein
MLGLGSEILHQLVNSSGLRLIEAQPSNDRLELKFYRMIYENSE